MVTDGTMTPNVNGRALVIDDQSDIRTLLRVQLRRAGFDAHTAGSVDEADRFIDGHDVDLILLDIVMPEKDGFLFLDALKKQGAVPKVVVITGGGRNMTPEFIENYSKALEADAVLFKPFSQDDLRKTLSELSFAI